MVKVMLVSFTVSNYRSFDQAVRFSMEAGKTRNFSNRLANDAGLKLLKFKAIYGANASGKSNLIRAIDFMRDTVLYGIPASSTMEYCRMNAENENRPSLFEIDISLGDVRYVYSVEIILSSSEFVSERLTEHKGHRSKLVFTRDILNGQYDVTSYINNTAIKERLEIYASDIKEDGSVLFLKSMNQNKDALYANGSKLMVYRVLYRWFQNKLSVNHPDRFITQYSYFFDSQSSAQAEVLLSRFDTGISGVKIVDEPVEKVMLQFPKSISQDILENLNEQKRINIEKGRTDIPAIMVRTNEHSMNIIELIDDDVQCKTLKFHHQHSSSLFSLEEESDGTIRLLDLLEILLNHSQNMVYVVDEVNRCLHPVITKQFVADFLQFAKESEIQLIVTTHETNLMDLQLLRKDEIGFVIKRTENGTSELSSLEDTGERFDKRIRRAYIEGEYGAVPRIQPK